MNEKLIDSDARPAPTPHLRSTFYVHTGKRTLDFLLAAAGLILAAPVMLVCAIAVRLSSPGPVFFRQMRVGRDGRTFKILKFRTMIDEAERNGPNLTVSNDPRVTSVGKVLRKAKLDELPQLVNVIRGDMSVVGPRPETPDHVALYSQVQREVLRVRPGITGRASLAFIDEEEMLAGASDAEQAYEALIMPRKLQQELAYCRTISLWRDLVLICRTVLSVLIHAKQQRNSQ